VGIFPERSPENGRRLVAALRSIGFEISHEVERGIVAGHDFVQIKEGPFDVDLVFAPEGIKSFAEAKERGLKEGICCVANLRDIIASKRASGRMKDEVELPLLESFRAGWEKQHPIPPRSAGEISRERHQEK
jgi:hypothetical protein